MIKNENITLRESGVIYRSVVEKVIKLYLQDKELGGELAVAVLQMCLSETTTSDNPMIELLLSEYKVSTERDHKRRDGIVQERRDNRRQEQQLDTIAELYFGQGRTQKQIAEQLGTTQQTISKRIKAIKNDYPELIPDKNTTKKVVQPYNQYNPYVYGYVYEYGYGYEYDYDYNSTIVYAVKDDNVVNTKTGEVISKISEADYARADYWDNTTDPAREIQEDPSIVEALNQYPNYLTLPMLLPDTGYPDKEGWLLCLGELEENDRAQQHLIAAKQGYRLGKVEKGEGIDDNNYQITL